MTEDLSTAAAGAGLDIMALHRGNARKLGRQDVLITSYASSGASLIGNVLIELGIDHLDPYSEVVDEEGRARVLDGHLAYRRRLAATAKLDAAGARGRSGEPRFVKNQLYPDAYDGVALGGHVLLVRDPRDAVYSFFRWYRDFAPLWWPEAGAPPDDFADFLARPAIHAETPIDRWTQLHERWWRASERFEPFVVVRFEDLKSDPVDVVAALLARFGVDRTRDEIRLAAGLSTFEAMRAHEDAVSTRQAPDRGRDLRLLRRGKVGEWREWFDASGLAAAFAEPRLRSAAARFGYHLPPGDGTPEEAR
ncbi:sulfotransferase domain-containing protein [Streptomyces sp. G45]|uniref:sulfotransferase domain-containing protein n=1 Tax=Streptomyces sp. G45 TaxID=3406627 RepID=UPI003C1B04D2